jgi:hypothetical protein
MAKKIEQIFAPKARKLDEVSGQWIETFDETNTEWCLFHNGREYRLPKVNRQQTMSPVFNEDGSVGLKVSHPDSELNELVEKFLSSALAAQDGLLTVSAEAYGNFIQLVRRLLSNNYSFSDTELAEILTMTTGQFSYLFSQILKHLR